MVADLQSRIVYQLPESSFPPQSHEDLEEECGLTDPPKRSRRSDRPRTAGKKSIPLLNRIQMDRGDLRLKTRNTAQAEKSLIERIEIDQIYRPRLGKPIDDNVFNHGGNHKKRRLSDRQNETGTAKQLNSNFHPSATFSRDHNVITPGNQDNSHRSSVHNQAVTPKALLDYLLPLAQQIADVRMATSQAGNVAVNSSVITAEVLAQFGQQLINLRKELHHHHGPQMFPVEETDISISDNGESRSPLRPSLNGHGHHSEEAITHEPSEMGKFERPQPLPDLRTPTPEYRDKRRPSSSASHSPPTNPTQPDQSRHHSSSEHRGTSKDFTHHDHRTERRSWDHHDYRRHSSNNRRHDPDRRYRRSISPSSRRTPYSSSKRDRRNSSPPRHRRRGSPLPYRRRRSPPSPELRRHSTEKSREFIPRRHIESEMSNHVKESYLQAGGLNSMSLQDLLQNYRGIASPQHGTRRVSELTVPGIWFAYQGSQEIGMSTIEFEFDEQKALKWDLQSYKGNTTQGGTESLSNNQERLKPSLELFCFTLDDLQMTIQNLGRDVRSHDIVQALSSLRNTWPPQGNLIVSINAESQNQKSWFPDTLRQKDSIKLEDFLHKGVNLVKFIQLSDLSGNVLVLLATENGIQNDYARLKILLPEKGGGTPFQSAIPTISKG